MDLLSPGSEFTPLQPVSFPRVHPPEKAKQGVGAPGLLYLESHLSHH